MATTRERTTDDKPPEASQGSAEAQAPGPAAASDPGAALSSAVDAARRSWDSLNQRLELGARIERHPLRAVAVALAAGYLLGGGLFTRLTGRVLLGGVRVGIRLAALPFVREEILDLVESASSAGREPGAEA